MSKADERDAIAAITERAWPAFRENGWKWRNKPITEARLALGIQYVVDHLRSRPELDTVSLGTLTAYRDETGVIHVTVEVGELPG